MSLHIGRLSPQVRQEDLERLFRRFGYCSVRLKDGYGFAVYDANDNAARAMRTLRGKYVCGERITVNWSNKQPRTSQGFRRSSRFIEPYPGRTFREGENNFRFRDAVAQKNHLANDHQRHNPDDATEKKSNELDENMKVAGDAIGEYPVEMKRDGGGLTDANAIENDRWGETGKGNLPSSGGDGDDFDRYEPYHGYGRQEETGNINKASLDDSHGHRYSSEKWTEHSAEPFDRNLDRSKSPPTCYNCGTAGHIARNCPQEVRVGKFKSWRDELSFREKQELRLKRFGSALSRRPEYSVDPVHQTCHRVRDGMETFSKRTRRARRLSNMPTGADLQQTTKKAHKRSRSRRSHGSCDPSDPSRHSHPDMHLRQSHSSRTSSDSRSLSSCPHLRYRSPSRSAYSGSKSPPSTRSEARSRSISNISYPVSLSVSVSPRHKPQPVAENKRTDSLLNSSLKGNEDCQIRSEFKHLADTEKEVKCSTLNSEVAGTSFKVDTLSNGELLVTGKDAYVVADTKTNLCKNLVNDDDIANGILGQSTNLEDASLEKSNQDILGKNVSSNSLNLSSIEVTSALKHYGMEAAEVESSHQSVAEYFGAARLWPWQIIYYRRLKKGPISTENYTSRLEQNKEHGIVDQYVRSSSGWWECH